MTLKALCLNFSSYLAALIMIVVFFSEKHFTAIFENYFFALLFFAILLLIKGKDYFTTVCKGILIVLIADDMTFDKGQINSIYYLELIAIFVLYYVYVRIHDKNIFNFNSSYGLWNKLSARIRGIFQ